MVCFCVRSSPLEAFKNLNSIATSGVRPGAPCATTLTPTGPTATGKSSIALALCKSLGGEIVSCDSVQVYKDVHIGCNKPSDQDTREVRHHLVDIASLDQTFTAGTQTRLDGAVCR